jgi:hypothetical protein
VDDDLRKHLAGLDLLEGRLADLEAERAVHRLLVAYGAGLDRGDEDLLADCFAPGGTWELERGGAVVRRYSTPEELRAWVRRHHEVEHPPHLHVFTNPDVRIDGDTGTATTCFLRVDAQPPASGERPFVHAMGTYADTVARCADGRWRFTTRVAHMAYGQPSPV